MVKLFFMVRRTFVFMFIHLYLCSSWPLLSFSLPLSSPRLCLSVCPSFCHSFSLSLSLPHQARGRAAAGSARCSQAGAAGPGAAGGGSSPHSQRAAPRRSASWPLPPPYGQYLPLQHLHTIEILLCEQFNITHLEILHGQYFLRNPVSKSLLN